MKQNTKRTLEYIGVILTIFFFIGIVCLNLYEIANMGENTPYNQAKQYLYSQKTGE